MKIAIVANGSQHQTGAARAMLAGLKRHGVAVDIRDTFAKPDVSIVICWGWRHGSRFRAGGADVLIMERGYVGDRFAWTSLGWNGLNGRADFRLPAAVDPSRWERNFAGLLKPWQCGGDCIVIMGQVSGDQSIEGVNIDRWVVDTYETLKRQTDRPVVFRPHPVAVERGHKSPPVPQIKGTLDEVLRRAAAVVTFNSNSGVDAVLAGVPTIAMDEGSMAWPVTTHEMTAQPVHRVRDEWAARLAWCQWRLEELKSGEAWEHLKIDFRIK